MIKVYYEENRTARPIKMWLDDIEDGALEQAVNLSNLPFLHKHVALMPDCHLGYGMPIGGVIATKGVVIPNAVGVDIGCGMCAMQTDLKTDDIDRSFLSDLMGKIRNAIPVGREHHKQPQDEWIMGLDDDCPIVKKEHESSLYQIGTLGSGNHFIEIQKDRSGFIWIMIHSGSRNVGYKVAKHYNKIAIDLNRRWRSEVPEKHELAFLPIETTEAKYYMREMEVCVKFASLNRMDMMQSIAEFIPANVSIKNPINIAHNYAAFENHFGENVIVHRKGATLAAAGTIGIIPGSQGTKGYIVKGLGNPESFNSCSHGAGRRMGRKHARRELDLNTEIQSLSDQGIIHSIRCQNDLDEAPSAYKDIDVVMKNQSDLVEIVEELTPLAVIKG